MSRALVKAAYAQEREAWRRYRRHVVHEYWYTRAWSNDHDPEAAELFNAWRATYEARLSLMPPERIRRRYRKGGLNLCRS